MKFEPNYSCNASLKSYNSFGLNSVAEYLAEVSSESEVQTLLSSQKFSAQRKFILGGGSNILLTKDIEGLTILNRILGKEILHQDDQHVYLKIGAGENWHQLVLYTLDQGWQGLENLSLIPGTVGAAPMQNIGAYGAELKDVFESLEAIKLSDSSKHEFNSDDCNFGYRYSEFKSSLKNQFMITSVTLRLNKKPKLNIEYYALQQALADSHIQHPSAKDISDIVIKIRQSKLPNPEIIGNAGSFFKNPIVDLSIYEKLKAKHADIPHFKTPDKNKVKIPAAWLIEKCGFKGKKFGEAGVHKHQPLVLVNFGKALGSEIKAVSEDIKETVLDVFEILLETEVNIL